MLKKIFAIDFFVPRILVPLLALDVYCLSFALFSSRVLIKGVNYFFTYQSWLVIMALVGVFYLVFWFIHKLRKGPVMDFRNFSQPFHPGDLLLLLLPLTPALQYILNNQDILSFQNSVAVFTFFILLAGLYTFILPALLGLLSPTRTLMLTGLAFITTIISMALISQAFHWYEKGNIWVQLLFLGATFLVTWLLARFAGRKSLYLVVGILFAVNSSFQVSALVGRLQASSGSMQQNPLLLAVDDRLPARTPNVYLLLYDAYAHNETMLEYGIDNSAQENHLVANGFTLYPHAYSVGQSTVTTMSRVLNASTEYYGNSRRAVSGDGVVQNIFKNLGYQTAGIFTFDFMFYGIGSSYDLSVPAYTSPTYINLISTILTGEFRDEVEFNSLTRPQFLASKKSIFSDTSGRPRFIYMHSNLPKHSQHSGVCRPNETKLYADRLALANLEMKEDIAVISDYDPGAIVIVAGDHGPYLTKNCASLTGNYDNSEVTRVDIQDRFGTFLAIRWPSEDYSQYDQIVVLQDVFPAVFAYLYQDAGILEAKIAPTILTPNRINDLTVINGIISGGANDGEPLFLSGD